MMERNRKEMGLVVAFIVILLGTITTSSFGQDATIFPVTLEEANELATSPDNLLNNPTFDQDISWAKSHYDNTAGSMWHAQFGREGGGVYLWTSRNKTRYGLSMSTRWQWLGGNWSPGDSLSLGFQFRGSNLVPGSYIYVAADYYRPDGSRISTFQKNLNWDEYTTKPSWETFSASTRIPEGTGKIQYVIAIYSTASNGTVASQATVYMDNAWAVILPEEEVPPIEECPEQAVQPLSNAEICSRVKAIVGLTCGEILELKETGRVKTTTVNIRGEIR